MFANGLGNLGSIPGRIIPKTLKMVLDISLLNTQQYKVCIKGKVEQSRERSSALPYTSVLELLKREPSGRPRPWSPTFYFIDRYGRLVQKYLFCLNFLKYVYFVINWITLTRKSSEHCVWYSETLDNCFDFISSHQQCISWSPPLEIEPVTTECRAETLPLSSIIKGFWTIVFIFIVISSTLRPICSSTLFRCLSNLGTFTELRTTSFIESTGIICSDSVSHN